MKIESMDTDDLGMHVPKFAFAQQPPTKIDPSPRECSRTALGKVFVRDTPSFLDRCRCCIVIPAVRAGVRVSQHNPGCPISCGGVQASHGGEA